MPGLQQVNTEGRNVNIYVYIRESNVVLQTLIKNKACARTRTRARRWRLPRARGWTAPRPHPRTRRASRRAAALSASPALGTWAARAPHLDPAALSPQAPRPLARSFRAASQTRSSGSRRFLSKPHAGLPTARAPLPPSSEEPVGPACRLPASELGATASRRQFRVRTGGATHSDLLREAGG